MMRHLFYALFFVWAAGAANAQEQGTATLEIAGESYSFPLWASQSDWSGDAGFGSVNIYARPTDDETWAKFKSFSLGFELSNGGGSNPEASLTRIVDGAQEQLFAQDEAEKGGLSVTVESVAVAGQELTVSGTFAGQMGTSETFGRDIDLSAPVPVSGRFDVVLGPVE